MNAPHLAPSDVLNGRETRLRLPRLEELSFIRTLWGDPETMAPVGGPIEFSESWAREWFARMVDPGGPSNCYCLIFDRKGAPVGEISFHHWDSVRRSAELNVKILAACRRKGYARDALTTFLCFFFGPVGGQLMVDEVAPGNRAGQRLLESAGFEPDPSPSEFCKMAMTRKMFLNRYPSDR